MKKIPSNIERREPVDSYFGRWDKTVPCVPFVMRDEVPRSDYVIWIEEYLIEQMNWKEKDGLLILPEEIKYDCKSGLIIPEKYDVQP